MPLTIGVVGPSGSGKTALATALCARFEASGLSSIVISADWFYRAPAPVEISTYSQVHGTEVMKRTISALRADGDVPAALAALPVADLAALLETQLSVEAATYNWDDPDALDNASLCHTLVTLQAGEAVVVAEFNFVTRQRDLIRSCPPADVVIVEGLFLFCDACGVEPSLDYKLFVDVSESTTWARKLARDAAAERGGHSAAYLRKQFEQAWRMNLRHIAPTKAHPGVRVVTNDAEADWEALVTEVFREVLAMLERRH